MRFPIAGYPGYHLNELGHAFGPRGKRLKAQVQKGYEKVWLYAKGKKRRKFRVSCLMLETFIGPRPSPEHEAAHNDGNRRNNHIKNLAWKTRQENTDDKRKHGTIPAGDKHPMAKINQAQIRMAVILRAEQMTCGDIGKLLKISEAHASRITRGFRNGNRKSHRVDRPYVQSVDGMREGQPSMSPLLRRDQQPRECVPQDGAKAVGRRKHGSRSARRKSGNGHRTYANA